MLCASCGHENRAGRKFCVHCGAGLRITCPSCGAKTEPGERFCGECGKSLGEAQKLEAARDPQANTPQHLGEKTPASGSILEGERRHLTVLFCDLVGSTEIAAHLDPEDWRDIALQYQRAAGDAVSRFSGYVAQYQGDGLVAYFGYPRARDNDAEHAVRAGLAILDAMTVLNRQLAEHKLRSLAVRVGIHTGSVVLGETGDAFGEVPNVASRVQNEAEPNTVVITASVNRLVSGLFVVEERGPRRLKGIAEPVELYRAVQPSGVRGRLRAAAVARGLTPFVGREDELRSLMNRWERAREGEGQVLVVVGEAGIGKSRLVHEFRGQIVGESHTWLECAGEPFFENTPFHAISQMLQQGSTERGDTAEERLSALERSLALAGINVEQELPLVAPILNLPLTGEYQPPAFPPEEQRRRLMAMLTRWAFGFARAQPMVMLLEDLHWADPSTLELTQILVEQGAAAPLLILCTARPEFRTPWPTQAHHGQMTLNRLSEQHTREMVQQVTVRAALASAAVETVVERTAGVPLFVEELTRLVLEGGGRAVAREIPATLHDSLMARLDRLGPAKEVAQVASVIGREFSYELLQAVSALPETDLRSALKELADVELLYVEGLPPKASYTFKHVLVQDTAYGALLRSRRRELHKTIAKVLSEHSRETESQPELLARHHTEAGDAEPAIAAWQRAGERAVARGALVEAEGHYRQAVTMLVSTPDTPERDRRELLMQMALGQVLKATKGYVEAETAAVFDRARALGERIADPAQLVTMLRGQFTTILHRGQMLATQALADQMLIAAERDGKPGALVVGHFDQGVVRYSRGDLLGARQHLTQSIALYDEAHHRAVPQDPGVEARSFLSLTCGQLGLADMARAHARDAVALAERLRKPFDVAFSRGMAARTYSILRLPKETQEFAESGTTYSREAHLPLFSLLGSIYLGWALAEQQRFEEGVELIRENLRAYRGTGNRLFLNLYLGFFAEAQSRAGALKEALATAEEAVSAAPDQEVYQPYVLWLRGELRLSAGIEELAEADFREATTHAHRIGAKLYELRAATSLARLLKCRRGGAEACALLPPLLAGFSEGFDIPDVIEAKALVEQLSS